MSTTKQTMKLARQPDCDVLCLHLTGGLRAAKVRADAWQIEPVLIDGAPCSAGPLTKDDLCSLAATNRLRAVAFQDMGWTNGCYHSSWKPIVPGRQNHLHSPANLWSNISSNLSRQRIAHAFAEKAPQDVGEMAEAFDARRPEEALAQHISLSLRGMDISLEQVVYYYNERLVSSMLSGLRKGHLTATTRDQLLFANAHSFFLHLGMARDYLAKLIAKRIGFDYLKVDSMSRLIERLRQSQSPTDDLLKFLFSSGCIARHPDKRGEITLAGWMDEATQTRNEVVHKRPYGSKFFESYGQVICEDAGAGIYRYFRPIQLNDGTDADMLDVIQSHYARCVGFFQEAAERSGYDSFTLHITDEDVVSQR